MEVLRPDDVERSDRARPACVATIGAYDGVHLGHRAVIAEVRRQADARGVASAVITFDRHPAQVVRPDSAPKLLTDLDQKLELLESTGVDIAMVVTFDAERASESAEEFVETVLVDALGAVGVVVGEDFHFGKGRRGNVELLRSMGRFEVLGMPLVGVDGTPEKVSSTAVRALLQHGDIGQANRLLGRAYEVRGVVRNGDRRGRELGFPTANVSVPNEICLPHDGIYAAWYERPDGHVWPAAVSLGRRPTFYAAQEGSLLEAFLIDFQGDLYREAAKVRFVAFLRGEERFDSVEALVEQMQRDVINARTTLGV